MLFYDKKGTIFLVRWTSHWNHGPPCVQLFSWLQVWCSTLLPWFNSAWTSLFTEPSPGYWDHGTETANRGHILFVYQQMFIYYSDRLNYAKWAWSAGDHCGSVTLVTTDVHGYYRGQSKTPSLDDISSETDQKKQCRLTPPIGRWGHSLHTVLPYMVRSRRGLECWFAVVCSRGWPMWDRSRQPAGDSSPWGCRAYAQLRALDRNKRQSRESRNPTRSQIGFAEFGSPFEHNSVTVYTPHVSLLLTWVPALARSYSTRSATYFT